MSSLLNNVKTRRIFNNKPKTIRHLKVKSLPVIPPIDISSPSHYMTSILYIKNNDSNYAQLTKTRTQTQSPKQSKMGYSAYKKKDKIHYNLHLHYRNNKYRNMKQIISPESNEIEHNYQHVLSESNLIDCKQIYNQSIMQNDSHSLQKIMDQCLLQISSGKTLEKEIDCYSKTKNIDYNYTYNTVNKKVKPLKSASDLEMNFLRDDINKLRLKVNQKSEGNATVSNSKSLERQNHNYLMINRTNTRRITKRIENLLDNANKFKRIIIQKVNREEERQKKERIKGKRII